MKDNNSDEKSDRFATDSDSTYDTESVSNKSEGEMRKEKIR